MIPWPPSKFLQTAPLGTVVLTLPILTPLVIAAGLTIGLSLRASQQVADRQAERLQEEISHHVEEHLNDYFSQPVTALELTLQKVKSGRLNPQDFKALEDHFWGQSQVFTQLNNIYWGNQLGESISIIRRADDSQELGIYTATPGIKFRFRLDEQGNPGELLQEYAYDPRQRPWYKTAVKARKMSWTEVYSWTNLPIMGITLTYPQMDTTGNIQGVFAVDFTLDRIQQFLQQLPVSQIGQVIILDRSGSLISSSTEEASFSLENNELIRLDLKQSKNEISRGISHQLDRLLKVGTLLQKQSLKLSIEGEVYLVCLEPWSDDWGLDWVVLTAIPENVFLEQIHRNTRNTALLNVGAFVIATVLSFFIARWITNQLRAKSHRIEQQQSALKQHAQELASTLQELEATQSQLVESATMAALGRLVAGVAHEVNTPVGTAILAASTLESETRSIQSFCDNPARVGIPLNVSLFEEFDRYLDTAKNCSTLILENLKRTGKLVQSFKKIAVDQSTNQLRKLHLKAYVEEVVGSLAPHLKPIPHEVRIVGDERFLLETDPGAISQIVTNLLLNSLTHAYALGEKVVVDIEVMGQGDSILLWYQDYGVGIPTEHLDKVFEPFFTTAASPNNSGLGLHVVYNLVTQRLRGTIAVDSTIGQGTQFVIRFPVRCSGA